MVDKKAKADEQTILGIMTRFDELIQGVYEIYALQTATQNVEKAQALLGLEQERAEALADIGYQVVWEEGGVG